MKRVFCIKNNGIFKYGHQYGSLKSKFAYQVHIIDPSKWLGLHKGWDYIEFKDFDSYFTDNYSEYINSKIKLVIG